VTLRRRRYSDIHFTGTLVSGLVFEDYKSNAVDSRRYYVGYGTASIRNNYRLLPFPHVEYCATTNIIQGQGGIA
jgi:hypothetical protein